MDKFKETFRQDLSLFKTVTDEEAIESLKENWSMATEFKADWWSPADRIARKVWAGIGLVVFGQKEYLKETLELIDKNPHVKKHKMNSYYVAMLKGL